MNRRVYVSMDNSVLSGVPVIGVENDVAAKMLEVYDESQKFQPVKILDTTIFVGPRPSLLGYPIRVVHCGGEGGYSLDEALAFAEALIAAVKYAINNGVR